MLRNWDDEEHNKQSNGESAASKQQEEWKQMEKEENDKSTKEKDKKLENHCTPSSNDKEEECNDKETEDDEDDNKSMELNATFNFHFGEVQNWNKKLNRLKKINDKVVLFHCQLFRLIAVCFIKNCGHQSFFCDPNPMVKLSFGLLKLFIAN